LGVLFFGVITADNNLEVLLLIKTDGRKKLGQKKLTNETAS